MAEPYIYSGDIAVSRPGIEFAVIYDPFSRLPSGLEIRVRLSPNRDTKTIDALFIDSMALMFETDIDRMASVLRAKGVDITSGHISAAFREFRLVFRSKPVDNRPNYETLCLEHTMNFSKLGLAVCAPAAPS